MMLANFLHSIILDVRHFSMKVSAVVTLIHEHNQIRYGENRKISIILCPCT